MQLVTFSNYRKEQQMKVLKDLDVSKSRGPDNLPPTFRQKHFEEKYCTIFFENKKRPRIP